MRTLLLLSSLLFVVACGDTDPAPECARNEDCEEGSICELGSCVVDVSTAIIRSFQAEKDPINLGESTRLVWDVAFVNDIQVTGTDESLYAVPTADLNIGSLEVSPQFTTTYTLTAFNEGKTTTATATLTVIRPDPEILEFSVTPSEVQEDAPITFNWKTLHAGRAELRYGGDSLIEVDPTDLEQGSWTTTRAAAGQYTLRVYGDGNTFVEESVNLIVVGEAPIIQNFAAIASHIVRDESTSLQWTVGNATTVEISNTTGVLQTSPNPSGQFNIRPNQTTTYTLRAINPYGESSTSVTVTVLDAIEIESFVASPPNSVAGESVELSWSILGTLENVYVSDGESTLEISPDDWNQGSMSVTPTKDTRYTLVAGNAAQSVTRGLDVSLLPAPPVISSFAASAALLPPGTFTTLSWSITGATSISITDGTQTLDTSGRPKTNGTLPVQVQGPTTYTLTATNDGGTDTATVFVDTAGIVTITNFTAEPLTVLAGQQTLLRWNVENSTNIGLTDLDGTVYDISNVLPGDPFLVTITQDKTFVLTATGYGGPAVASILVTTGLPVTIDSFTVDQSSVIIGQDVVFSWTTSNAESLSLTCETATELITVDITTKAIGSDSVSVRLPASAQCLLRAFGLLGPAVFPLGVSVIAPAPTITSFGSNSPVLLTGHNLTLTWSVTSSGTLTLTDDLGQTVNVSNQNFNNGSVTLPATRTATYTLTAANQAGSQQMSTSVVVVAPNTLLINEMNYDPANADDQREWVELINLSDDAIDLQFFSLANGGTSYLYTAHQLSGVIPPRGCMVIGGPLSDAGNGNPAIDVNLHFSPNLQNGGAMADAIGLFYGTVTASSVPMDTVLYGTANTNNLIGEDGLPKTVLSEIAAPNETLSRVALTDVFESTIPSPNRCFTLTGLSHTEASNQANGTLEVYGWGLDARLFEVQLGSQILNCSNSNDGLSCDFNSTGDIGDVSVTVTRKRHFVSTPAWVIADLPGPSWQAETLPNAFTFVNETPDPGVEFWCGIQATTLTANAGNPINVDVEIYVQNATDTLQQLPAGWSVQALLFDGGLPQTVFPALWTDANQTAVVGNNVLYSTDFTSTTAGTFEVAYRVSPDGINFYYCDTVAEGGSDNGYTMGGGAELVWN